MDNQMFVDTIVILSAITLTTLVLIMKDVYKRALILFLCIFIVVQLAAYLLNIDIIKAVVPHKDGGTSYQIVASSLIPLALGFILDFAEKKISKKVNINK